MTDETLAWIAVARHRGWRRRIDRLIFAAQPFFHALGGATRPAKEKLDHVGRFNLIRFADHVMLAHAVHEVLGSPDEKIALSATPNIDADGLFEDSEGLTA